VCVCVGLSDADSQADGQQELSGKTSRGRRNSGFNVDDLLGQDWNSDAESHDGGTHVV